MTGLDYQFDNIDMYLDLSKKTRYQEAIIGTFSGEEGSFEGVDIECKTTRMPYNSLGFKNELREFFIRRLGGEKVDNIRLDPQFKVAVENNKDLGGMLEEINRQSTCQIGMQIRRIGDEDWKAGERGTLLKDFENLAASYIKFKNAWESQE